MLPLTVQGLLTKQLTDNSTEHRFEKYTHNHSSDQIQAGLKEEFKHISSTDEEKLLPFPFARV
jgi:hypothetical protein